VDSISQSIARLAFAHWLRTGRRLPIRKSSPIETKFNPWHDPTNGRFTFANSGANYGYRGEGGSFGSGGASGSWPKPKKVRPVIKPLPAPKHAGATVNLPARPAETARLRPAEPPPVRAAPSPTQPFRCETRNGYEFQIDAAGHTRRISGTLTMGNKPRNKKVQQAAGGKDRRSTDDGGHYIARRFNGPPDDFNIFPQDSNFNRGKYRRLEDQWAKAKRAGDDVEVKITPIYPEGSKRPSCLDVIFSINGFEQSVKLPNESIKGK